MNRNKNKSNKNRKNNNKQRKHVENARSINLYTNSVRRFISSTQTVYLRTAATTYSLASGADIRYLPLSTLIASTDFTNMAAVYSDYRIKSVTVACAPYGGQHAFQNNIAILYLAFDPTGAAANPTNLTIISSDDVRLFAPQSTKVDIVTFRFPGVSGNTNLWIDTTVAPSSGAFYIGSNLMIANTFGANVTYWDLRFDADVEFANPK